MIIHKKDFGENWPFTVDEVDARHFNLYSGWAIKRKKVFYALSGILEQYSFKALEQSGIWADDPEIPGAKKSITPLMEYLARLK